MPLYTLSSTSNSVFLILLSSSHLSSPAHRISLTLSLSWYISVSLFPPNTLPRRLFYFLLHFCVLSVCVSLSLSLFLSLLLCVSLLFTSHHPSFSPLCLSPLFCNPPRKYLHSCLVVRTHAHSHCPSSLTLLHTSQTYTHTLQPGPQYPPSHFPPFTALPHFPPFTALPAPDSPPPCLPMTPYSMPGVSWPRLTQTRASLR